MSDKIIEENIIRNAILDSPYDPISGMGSPIKRQEVYWEDFAKPFYFPMEMMKVDWVAHLASFKTFEEASIALKIHPEELMFAITQERYKHDFEFWAATTIKIQDKDSFQDVPFILRGAQRKVLIILERQRVGNKPIRLVLLKSRQWGGSTLIQIYMMWIQQIHRYNWHLAVCAQDDNAARNIRGMYTRAAKLYPKELGSITLNPYEQSPKNRICLETGGIIGVGSINNPDQFRSYNYAMVHISEPGVWQDTAQRTAQQLITSLKETVPDVPYSLIAEESTAKGLNYFYDSYTRAETGKTRYEAVFVAWFEIDRNRLTIKGDINEFIKNMSGYDKYLWELGATLEGINWYNKHKQDRYEEANQQNRMFSEVEMMQENPSTAEEAFRSSGEKRFNPQYLKIMESDCYPAKFIGDVKADATQGEKAFDNIEFIPNSNGRLRIWEMPDKNIEAMDRYVAYLDVGGVWKGADYTVLKILDRLKMASGGDPETVAVYYGQIDKDLAAWRAAQICTMYNNALLAIESNFYDKDRNKDDHSLTAIDKLALVYPNLYIRSNPEKVEGDYVPIYGFHLNKRTKPQIINSLYAASRERYNKEMNKQDGFCLIERDIRAVKEMSYYEVKKDGSLGAIDGQNDDHVDATAGVFYIATDRMPLPQIIDKNKKVKKRVMKSEASF